MKRSSLILVLLLIVSAAFNLAIAGLFVGHWLHGNTNSTHVAAGAEGLIGLIPAPQRAEVGETMRPRNEEMRVLLGSLRTARRDAADALRQRPFDPAAADAALAELRHATTQVQERLHRAMVERMGAAQTAGTLPPPPERPAKPKAEKGPPPGR